MLKADTLHERGKALEDEYFHRIDEALNVRLRESIHRDEAKVLLVATLGFNDDSLIEHLLDAGLQAGTVPAMVLVPLVFVAWSDGKITAKERQSVMTEALNRGLGSTEQTLQLVQHWLEKRPPKSLWDVWCEYIKALRKSLPIELDRNFSSTVLDRCEAVARASADLFGTEEISKPERAMLDRIRATLSEF